MTPYNQVMVLILKRLFGVVVSMVGISMVSNCYKVKGSIRNGGKINNAYLNSVDL